MSLTQSTEEQTARGRQANASLHDRLQKQPIPGVVYAEIRWDTNDEIYVLDMVVTATVVSELLDASRAKKDYFMTNLGDMAVSLLDGVPRNVWVVVRDGNLKIIAEGLYPHS